MLTSSRYASKKALGEYIARSRWSNGIGKLKDLRTPNLTQTGLRSIFGFAKDRSEKKDTNGLVQGEDGKDGQHMFREITEEEAEKDPLLNFDALPRGGIDLHMGDPRWTQQVGEGEEGEGDGIINTDRDPSSSVPYAYPMIRNTGNLPHSKGWNDLETETVSGINAGDISLNNGELLKQTLLTKQRDDGLVLRVYRHAIADDSSSASSNIVKKSGFDIKSTSSSSDTSTPSRAIIEMLVGDDTHFTGYTVTTALVETPPAPGHVHHPAHSAMLMTTALLPAEPSSALILGLRGTALPDYLRAYFPECEVRVAEDDPDFISSAKEYLGFDLPTLSAPKRPTSPPPVKDIDAKFDRNDENQGESGLTVEKPEDFIDNYFVTKGSHPRANEPARTFSMILHDTEFSWKVFDVDYIQRIYGLVESGGVYVRRLPLRLRRGVDQYKGQQQQQQQQQQGEGEKKEEVKEGLPVYDADIDSELDMLSMVFKYIYYTQPSVDHIVIMCMKDEGVFYPGSKWQHPISSEAMVDMAVGMWQTRHMSMEVVERADQWQMYQKGTSILPLLKTSQSQFDVTVDHLYDQIAPNQEDNSIDGELGVGGEGWVSELITDSEKGQDKKVNGSTNGDVGEDIPKKNN